VKIAAVTRIPVPSGRPARAASPAVRAVTASEGIGWHDRANAGTNADGAYAMLWRYGPR